MAVEKITARSLIIHDDEEEVEKAVVRNVVEGEVLVAENSIDSGEHEHEQRSQSSSSNHSTCPHQEVGSSDIDAAREARIRLREQQRELRMKEREKEERGEDEEEPPDGTIDLMKRLHTSLSKSSNPRMLEIQIMAKHSSDERFSFLHKGGKWSAHWTERKFLQSEETKADKEGSEVLMLAPALVGYGYDSESEGEEGSKVSTMEAPPEADILLERKRKLEDAEKEPGSNKRREIETFSA
ncbi:hypothetical protein BT69DRAFT_1287723 [Atractiella rhizophila]|nr:hypothetical protein BT69DRAFT_1287723 [Atractiella rhizophila]